MPMPDNAQQRHGDALHNAWVAADESTKRILNEDYSIAAAFAANSQAWALIAQATRS